MRTYRLAFAALGLAACSPAVPDSGLGVGFQDYNSYIENRQAVLAQPLSAGSGALPGAGVGAQAGFSAAGAAAAIANAQGGIGAATADPLAPRSLQEQAALLSSAQPAPVTAVPAQPVAQVPLAPSLSGTGRVIGSSETAPTAALAPAGAAGDLNAVRPRGNAPAGISETVSEMAVVGGVSDEQDFEAVAARETIESDKARIEKNRSQYQIDQPGALPQRTGSGPSIVEYALATQHPVGVKLFRRSPLRFKKVDVACAPYANADLAQEAFLGAGGPDRDRLGMDPDGDGYACNWDPSPYRAVAQ